jgi:hypothetical protein
MILREQEERGDAQLNENAQQRQARVVKGLMSPRS